MKLAGWMSEGAPRAISDGQADQGYAEWALYFYRITYGEGTPPWPHEAVELADDEAAWIETTTACAEMLRDLDGALKAGPEWRMEAPGSPARWCIG